MCYVLIVDDDKELCNCLERILRDHTVEVANNLKQAEDIIEEASPDIILLDLKLGPGQDGREFLKSRSWHSAVIIMTGIDMDPTLEADLLEEGAAAVVTKPFESRKVRVLVERLSELMGLTKSLQHYREKLVEATRRLHRARGVSKTSA